MPGQHSLVMSPDSAKIVILEFVTGKVDKAVSEVRLRAGESIRIGRTNQCELVLLGDGSVSSKHAALQHDGLVVKLVDLQSTNGTYVNGDRIIQTELRHHDEIQIGSCVLRVKFYNPELATEEQPDESSSGTEVASGHNSIFVFDDDSSLFTTRNPQQEVDSLLSANSESVLASSDAIFRNSLAPANSDEVAENDNSSEIQSVQPCRLVGNFVLPEGGNGHLVIADGQVLTIGRTFKSDFEVDDSDMQPLHFSIRLNGNQAELRNLTTSGSTLLNGVPVQQEKINDGDSIVAGRTCFHITISGSEVVDSEPKLALEPGEPDEKPEETTAELGGTFQRQKLPNSIFYYSIDLEGGRRNLIQLFQDFEFLFVVDGKNLNSEFYAKIPKSHTLFSGMPAGLVMGPIPLILSGSQVNATQLHEKSEKLDYVAVGYLLDKEDENGFERRIETVRQYGGFFVSAATLRAQLIQMYDPGSKLSDFQFFVLCTEAESTLFSLVDLDEKLKNCGLKIA